MQKAVDAVRAPVSIVIPTLNAASGLPRTLASLVPGLEFGMIREVIVSDGGSTDQTQAIAEGTGAVVLQGPAGRGGQLQRGAHAAQGAWILFLHADTVLPVDWPDRCGGHIATSPEMAGYFDLKFDQTGPAPWLVAGWANLRSRVFRLPYGDQGLLISQRHYAEIGGFADVPLMEDVDMARRIGERMAPLGARVTSSADRYRKQGWVRRSLGNAWLLTRYQLGADPRDLARAYQRTRPD